MSLNDRLIIASIVAMCGYFSLLPMVVIIDVFFGAIAAIGTAFLGSLFYLAVIKAIFEYEAE